MCLSEALLTSKDYPQHMFSLKNNKNIMWIPLLSVAMQDHYQHFFFFFFIFQNNFITAVYCHMLNTVLAVLLFEKQIVRRSSGGGCGESV